MTRSEAAELVAIQSQWECATLRVLLADGEWHPASALRGLAPPLGFRINQITKGADGHPPVTVERARLAPDGALVLHRGRGQPPSDDGVWFRISRPAPRSIEGAIKVAARSWRPPSQKTYRCSICGDQLAEYWFTKYPSGQRSMACEPCLPEASRRAARRRAERLGRAYLSLDQRRERARATAADRAQKREERARRASDPEHQRALLNARKTRRKRAIGDAYVEPVNRAIVAIRDGWRCAICGRKVTRRTWSLDHVVPLSKGGEHSYRNVVLAHLKCNVSRGPGRRASQAPLFGRIDT